MLQIKSYIENCGFWLFMKWILILFRNVFSIQFLFNSFFCGFSGVSVSREEKERMIE